MRNLEDCKVEIFRRSEERIRKRNKIYKYIITGTLSLFLCFSLGSMVVVPILRLGNKGMANQVEEDIILETQIQSSSKLMSYDKVEIIKINGSEEATRMITDFTEVTQIFEVVLDVSLERNIEFEIWDTNEEYKVEWEETPQELAVDDVQEQKYKIIFLGKTEEKVIYVLEGNILYEEGSGKKWLVTEAQRVELETYMHE